MERIEKFFRKVDQLTESFLFEAVTFSFLFFGMIAWLVTYAIRLNSI